MHIEKLHTFTEEDWEVIAKQYEGLYHGTAELITENKGSIPEAQDTYVESFIYYTQLLELHGLKLMDQAEQIIYSFSRKLWIQKLRKRNVDVNFVKHRREFFEMEDAFHEIDAIKERSDRTAEKLASIGEPSRTLILEFVGRNTPLVDISARLRFRDEDHAFEQVAKSLRRLIKITEGKEFDTKETEFSAHIRYVLDNQNRESVHLEESDKVCVAMISRTVAMIRNYITRTDRMQHLRDLKLRISPDNIQTASIEPQKKSKMKPLALFSIAAVIALTISVITSFTIAKNVPQSSGEELTEISVEAEPIEESIIADKPQEAFNAFALNNEGILITTAEAVKGRNSVMLAHFEQEINLQAAVMHIDTMLNLAVLQVNGEVPFKVSHRMAPDDPNIGQAYFTVGMEEGALLFAEGNLNASTKNGIGKTTLSTSLNGAPLISDKGQLIGIVVSRSDADSKVMSQVIYGSQMRKFLNDWAEGAGVKMDLPQRNKLFYSSREEQISKISNCVFQIAEKTNSI